MNSSFPFRIARRIWNSPTLMTLGSMATRVGGMAILLPLALRTLSSEELAFWLLIGAVGMLQIVGDMGFSQTFVRSICNVRGGASIEELGRINTKITGGRAESNQASGVSVIVSLMRKIYFRLSIGCVFLLASLGTYSIVPVVQALREYSGVDGWSIWGVVVLANGCMIWGNVYQAYLMGMERVALLRRWETVFGLLTISSSCIVLIADAGLAWLVISQNVWMVFGVFRNRWLCKKDESFTSSEDNQIAVGKLFSTIWPSAWRSGLGVLTSIGVIQSSGFVLARLVSAEVLAGYMLGLRLIQTISQMSSAPFYSKIPSFARLCAEREYRELVTSALRAMKVSNISFLFGFFLVGAFASDFLQVIGSQTKFPSRDMWALLGLAFYVERVGAMHIQLYSTTNHIIWHYANGLTGVVMVFSAYAIFPILGVFSFPVSMFFSYLLIYCSISLFHSYREFSIRFVTADGTGALIPLILASVVWWGIGVVDFL